MTSTGPNAIVHPDPDALDCLSCGACCRSGAGGTLLVPEQDLVRWSRAGRPDIARAVQPGHFGMLAFATREDGACVHLGTADNPNACSIYELRGTTCHEFPKGSRQCLEFRRQREVD